ncbi:hypothetical protein RDWZM_009991, partial [Blomia tropicalis]
MKEESERTTLQEQLPRCRRRVRKRTRFAHSRVAIVVARVNSIDVGGGGGGGVGGGGGGRASRL